jgi:hypothetical protein
VAVRVSSSPPRLHVLWSAGAGGGPPIFAGNRVWTIGQDGVLYGLDPATGAIRQSAAIGTVANHFPTPGVGDGLLLAPAANRVVAFRTGAARIPAGMATSPAGTRTAASTPAGGGGGAAGLPAWAWGLVVAAAVVLAGAVGATARRRR